MSKLTAATVQITYVTAPACHYCDHGRTVLAEIAERVPLEVREYGMLGVYGHGDRPSHSFVLVDADGTISGVRHYAEMFVPVAQLLADLDLADRG